MKNTTIKLSLRARFSAAPTDPAGPSPRVVEVAAMFGLGADRSRAVDVLPETDLVLRPGQLVFVTGASGSGKSTLLRLIAEGLAGPEAERVRVIDFAGLAAPVDGAVVDTVDDGRLPLDRVLKVLSLAGLNDAFVMLRRPEELSDGQR
ncbi:MAG: ATP-binding cassette domain-containing protein [Planctomycetota bacterium]